MASVTWAVSAVVDRIGIGGLGVISGIDDFGIGSIGDIGGLGGFRLGRGIGGGKRKWHLRCRQHVRRGHHV